MVNKRLAVAFSLVLGSMAFSIIPMVANANATAPLSEKTAVPTPTNNTTPSYTFNSTASGTIAYTGDCKSVTTAAIVGDNTIILEASSGHPFPDGTYSNCQIQVNHHTLNVSTFTVDTQAPTLSQLTAVPSSTNDNTPNYTFSSSEAGTITYGGSCSSHTTSASSNHSGNTITFNTLVNGIYSDCTIKVTDAAGNVSLPLSVNTFTVDTQGPTVTINQAAGQADPTNISPVTFAVVFSEPVSDFFSSDVSLSGVNASGITVSGSSTTYTVSVAITNPTNGTITATVPAGKAHDAAGNGNQSSTSSDNTVVFNNEPDLTVTKTNDLNGGSAVVGQTFNWVLTASNTNAPAVFSKDDHVILQDNLPSDGASYGTPLISTTGGVTGSFACSIDHDDNLKCNSNAHDNSVTIPVGATIVVTIPVTPTGAGSLVNPRSGHDNVCAVDPDNAVNESNVNNNSCSNTVTVIANTGTLIVKKVVVNQNGGIATASDFSFTVNGGSPISFNSNGENDLTVAPGSYTVTEPATNGYVASYSDACGGTTVQAGATTTCTITNTDQPATLTIVKKTIGGDDTFAFTVARGNSAGTEYDILTSGGTGSTTVSLPAGATTVTELGRDGWTLTSEECDYDGESVGNVLPSGGEKIFPKLNAHIVCTFTNTSNSFVSPTTTSSLTVDIVHGPEGSGASVQIGEDSPVQYTGPIVLNNGDTFSVVGTPVDGYTITPSGDCSLEGEAGNAYVCTLTYSKNDVPFVTVSIDPKELSSGTVGQPYSQTFTASDSGNYREFTFSENGVLPDGLTFDPGNGGDTATLSGTPSTAGTSTFSVKVTTDQDGNPSATNIYTLTINPAHEEVPATSTLNVTLNVDNTGGGTAAPSDFGITVLAAGATPATFPGSSDGTNVTINANASYSVNVNFEGNNYTQATNGVCAGSGIAASGTVDCVITETFVPSLNPNPNPPSVNVGAGGNFLSGGQVLGASISNVGVGSTSTTSTADIVAAQLKASGCSAVFHKNLWQGVTNADVLKLQKALNSSSFMQVAASGPGSAGNETNFFGNTTKQAVMIFQNIFANEILVPLNLTSPTGFFGPYTRAQMNALCLGK